MDRPRDCWWWEVKLYWYGASAGSRFESGHEAGSHCTFEEGDTPLQVARAVADGRGIDIEKCHGIEVYLHRE